MSDEGPAMVEASINGVHAITLPFRIDDTRWALNPSFVVFVGAAIRYLGEDVGRGCHRARCSTWFRGERPAAGRGIRDSRATSKR
jgi:hypothetical protein